jgi:hypothetical protein
MKTERTKKSAWRRTNAKELPDSLSAFTDEALRTITNPRAESATTAPRIK